MIIALWDTETGNLAGEYPSEQAALADVRHLLHTRGREFAENLALVQDDEVDDPSVMIAGTELMTLALLSPDSELLHERLARASR